MRNGQASRQGKRSHEPKRLFGTDHSDLHFGVGVSPPGLQNMEWTYSFGPEGTPRHLRSNCKVVTEAVAGPDISLPILLGVAYDAQADFIRCSDGMVNHWYNIGRPNVVMEDGHVVAFTFAAADTEKNSITATDNSGSKIIVVPFEGKSFDRDMRCAD